MGDDCCPQSKLEEEFSKIQREAYHKAKDGAKEFYVTLLKKKEDELYSRYAFKLISELYLRVLKGKIKIKSEKMYYGKYRIYAFVEGQETYLFEL